MLNSMGAGGSASDTSDPCSAFSESVVSLKEDDWKGKCSALDRLMLTTQQGGFPKWWLDSGALSQLKIAFDVLLLDLRSQLVKHTCTALLTLASLSTSHLAPLLRSLLPSFKQLTCQTVKVIQSYATFTLEKAMSFTNFSRSLLFISDWIKHTKQKDGRLAGIDLLNNAIIHWGRSLSSVDPGCVIISSAISRALEDPGQSVRIRARAAFATFYQTFPTEAGRLLDGFAGTRLRALLLAEVGASSGEGQPATADGDGRAAVSAASEHATTTGRTSQGAVAQRKGVAAALQPPARTANLGGQHMSAARAGSGNLSSSGPTGIAGVGRKSNGSSSAAAGGGATFSASSSAPSAPPTTSLSSSLPPPRLSAPLNITRPNPLTDALISASFQVPTLPPASIPPTSYSQSRAPAVPSPPFTAAPLNVEVVHNTVKRQAAVSIQAAIRGVVTRKSICPPRVFEDGDEQYDGEAAPMGGYSGLTIDPASPPRDMYMSVRKSMAIRRKSCIGVQPLPATPSPKKNGVAASKDAGFLLSEGDAAEKERPLAKGFISRVPLSETVAGTITGAPASKGQGYLVLKAHKSYVNELLETLRMELDVITRFEASIVAPASSQSSPTTAENNVEDYIEAITACLDARRAIDAKLRDDIRKSC